MANLFDELLGIGDAMKTTAKTAEKKTAIQSEFKTVVINGMTVYVRKHGGTPEESRAAWGRTIARAKADKRRGDAVKFLKEFRDDPRA